MLDYGCGDGTFLGLLQAAARHLRSPSAPRSTRASSPTASAGSRQCPGVRFVDVAELDRDDEAGSYDAIFCMEVLEHVD